MSSIDQTPEPNINRVGQTNGDQWTFLAPRHRHQQRDARGRFIPATVTPPRTESPALTTSSSFLSSLSTLSYGDSVDSLTQTILSQPPTPFTTSPHSTHFEHPPPPPAYSQWPGDPSHSAHNPDDFSHSAHNPDDISHNAHDPGDPNHSTRNPDELEESLFITDMSNAQIQPFHGDGENNENPQDFLKSIMRMALANKWQDQTKIDYFSNSLKSDSQAEDWFLELPNTSTDTWAHLVAAFNDKWPSKTTAPKSRAERHQELEECILTEAELGTKKMMNGREEHAHVVWVDKIYRLAQAIPDNDGLLIGTARKQIPIALQALLKDDYVTWKSFVDAVRKVTTTAIKEQQKLEDERKELQRMRMELNRLSRVTQPPNTPSKALAASFQTMGLQGRFPQPNFQQVSTSPSPQIPQQPRQTSGAPAQRFTPYRSDAERLQLLQQNRQVVHQTTPEGLTAYNAAVAAWNATWGNLTPNETRPYPLTPGTSNVATRECWKCGLQGHTTPSCTSTTPIPPLETRWRITAANIARLGRQLSMEPQAGPSTTPTSGGAQINFVNNADNGWDNIPDEVRQQVIYEWQLHNDQGKGRGPTE